VGTSTRRKVSQSNASGNNDARCSGMARQTALHIVPLMPSKPGKRLFIRTVGQTDRRTDVQTDMARSIRLLIQIVFTTETVKQYTFR